MNALTLKTLSSFERTQCCLQIKVIMGHTTEGSTHNQSRRKTPFRSNTGKTEFPTIKQKDKILWARERGHVAKDQRRPARMRKYRSIRCKRVPWSAGEIIVHEKEKDRSIVKGNNTYNLTDTPCNDIN